MRMWGLPAMALALALGYGAHAWACALDDVPSLRANGARAVLNLAQPAGADPARWAPFIFARAVSRGAPVRLDEDRRELARTLPPELIGSRWLWRTSDGWQGYGWAVIHRFVRPGTYLVTVAAVLPAQRGAFIFDAALLRVH